jgi:hypothetical protein
MRQLAYILFAAALVVWANLATAQTPTASIAAVRTSGAPPLYVHFDGFTNTTTASPILDIADRFHELSYEWDFGDSGAGTWATDGKSKNVDYGPIAAHVYDDASGSPYTVTLTVCSAVTCNTTTQAITVNDPEVVWGDGGTNTTLCISNDNSRPAAGSNGCPVGADVLDLQVDTKDLDDAIRDALVAGDRRILLERGHTYGGAQIWDSRVEVFYNGPGLFGAFGLTGNPPDVDMSGMTSGSLFVFGQQGVGNDWDDWRVEDWDLQGSGDANDIGLASENSYGGRMRQLLLYNLNFDGTDAPIYMVGCTATDMSNKGFFVYTINGAFMGNDFDAWPTRHPNGEEHTFRLAGGVSVVISHSRFVSGGADAGTIRACTNTGGEMQSLSCDVLVNTQTQYILVSDNQFLGPETTCGTCGRLLDYMRGQNQAANRGDIHDIITQNNYFNVGYSSGINPIHMITQRHTVRNNIFDATNASGSTNGMWIRNAPASQADPNTIHVYNNTFFSDKGSGTLRVATVDSNATNVLLDNNLLWGTGTISLSVYTGSGDVTTNANHIATSNPFPTSPPYTRAQFVLAEGSGPIDVGNTTNFWTNWDHYWGPRNLGSDVDAGADEYGTPVATGSLGGIFTGGILQ